MSSSGLHNQKRTKTTEDELRIKIEKDEKLIKEYSQICNEMYTKRKSKDYSKDALQLTTRILIENPEFYTAWNYRREVLSAQMSILDKEQVQNLLQEDIPLIDSLLKRVPKSYWVWNHRRWVLENCPQPLWETELNILNYMLDLDARNFHGWDYRRYVVSKSRISIPKQEFEYTTRKIHQNFSNFSAWHYRSKVMQSAFPDNDSYHAQIKSDVELVRNAIFTEPGDQSAWLYQRYLFRKDKENVLLLNAYLIWNANEMKIVLIFNQSVKPKNLFHQIQITTIDGKKCSGIGLMQKSSTVQSISVQRIAAYDFSFKVERGFFEGASLDHACSEINIFFSIGNTITGALPLSIDESLDEECSDKQISSSELESELEIIQELAEVEPDSKWVLLTLVFFYERVGKHMEEAIKLLHRLENLDPFRVNYYRDYKSRLTLQSLLTNDMTEVNLQNLGLTEIQTKGQLMLAQRIDLSFNDLKSLSFAKFMQSVTHLNLDHNQITDLNGIQSLNNLKSLSVKWNKLKSIENVIYIKGMTMEEVHLEENLLDKESLDIISTWLEFNH